MARKPFWTEQRVEQFAQQWNSYPSETSGQLARRLSELWGTNLGPNAVRMRASLLRRDGIELVDKRKYRGFSNKQIDSALEGLKA